MTAALGFRGGSADAVATLTDQIAGLAGAGAGELGTVAEELFSIAGTLRGEGALRRFATDNSVATEARAGMITDLFAGKVSSPTLDLATTAVKQRWTRTRDLADALEQAGVVAAVRAAGGESQRLIDELFMLRTAVAGNVELRGALSDPSRTQADKAGLLVSLLEGKALPTTILLAQQSLSGSYRTPVAALEDYEKIAAGVHGEGVATVQIARPLSEADTQRLADALSRQYSRQIHLNIVVDPDLVGGIRVEIGDDVIDGTVSSRLADAERLLAG